MDLLEDVEIELRQASKNNYTFTATYSGTWLMLSVISNNTIIQMTSISHILMIPLLL
jgi:hypothetical protein